MKLNVIFTGLILVAGVVSGCSGRLSGVANPGALIQDLRTSSGDEKPKIDPTAPDPKVMMTAPSIQVTAVVNKETLLSQEFLYGSDLQYSSLYYKNFDLYFQSLALGHIPAKFRIVGDELQLVADNKRLYPSEVNHPEQLLSRFKILEDSPNTLKITTGDAGVYLSLLFTALGGASESARDSWIRSFEYVAQDQLILQQTSILTADGTIAEFMESIMPSSALAPGAQFEKFEMDPEDPVGAQEGPAARFRFLKGETIFQGEKKLTFAQHFDLSPRNDGKRGAPGAIAGTIDWYVTSTIPDEYLEPVRLAVEGWNRYFKKFNGIEREVVRFLGRLPDGIYLGDPRYNIINWDSRLIAGAAYESQASDPMTGKQSHSLIYMPAAWVTIGTSYWENGQYSDPVESLSPSSKLGRLSCLRNLRSAASLIQSGRVGADEVKEFGKELLKGTLFHEVGHALGLAHNFKGSLSFDRTQPKTNFSASIMDYNDFEIERGAFSAVQSADGPELEYDRQALSAIYNRMKDLNGSAVMPVCNDEEADNEAGGVDPLCIRYDIEKDPTLSITTAWKRIQEPVLAGDISLSQALFNGVSHVLADEALQVVKSAEDLSALESRLVKSLEGSIRFYLLTGKASFSRVVRTNVKSLLQFQEGVLPADYSEREMRERAFAGVQKTLGLFELPDGVKAALQDVARKSGESILKTPYVQSLTKDTAEQLKDAVKKKVDSVVGSVAKNTASGLPRLRELVLSTLTRHKGIDFFFGKVDGIQLDFETAILGILGDTVGERDKFTQKERVAAATSLITYRGRLDANDVISRLTEKLRAERKLAEDNRTRANAQAILGVLEGAV